MSSSTIYDIAKVAGVSIATVSRVFNDASIVSPRTKQKVLEVAKTLGYHPKAYAQVLARQQTKMLTILVPVISNYFFMEILSGIQDNLSAFGYDLNIYNLNTTDPEDLKEQIDYVLKRKMADGYFLISVHQQGSDWEQLKIYDIPIVLIDEYHPDFDSISVDNIEGAYNATQYFINQGFRKIAMISANPNSQPIKDRKNGYKRALEDSGFIVDESLIITGDNLYRDGFTEDNGYHSMVQIIEHYPDTDAVICTSDSQALGALKALSDHKKALPVIGFDDLSISKFFGLTTMRQPMYEMGSLALEKLINRIHNPESMISHTVFSPEIIVRESTTLTKITTL